MNDLRLLNTAGRFWRASQMRSLEQHAGSPVECQSSTSLSALCSTPFSLVALCCYRAGENPVTAHKQRRRPSPMHIQVSPTKQVSDLKSDRDVGGLLQCLLHNMTKSGSGIDCRSLKANPPIVFVRATECMKQWDILRRHPANHANGMDPCISI